MPRWKGRGVEFELKKSTNSLFIKFIIAYGVKCVGIPSDAYRIPFVPVVANVMECVQLLPV